MQPDPDSNPAQSPTLPPTLTPVPTPVREPQIIQPQAVVSPEPVLELEPVSATMPSPPVVAPTEAVSAESMGAPELPVVASALAEEPATAIAEPMAAPSIPELMPEPIPEPAPTPMPELEPVPASVPGPLVIQAETITQPEVAPQPESAAAILPAASAPLAPEVAPMVNPIQAPTPTPSADSAPKEGKRLKIIVGVVAAVVVLVIIGLVAIVSLGGKQQIVYTSSDVSTVSAPTYTINRAKEWTDVSSNKAILNYLQSSLGATSSLTDQKIYTYKYDFKTNKAQTLMLVGDTALGVTDVQLREGLKIPAAKQQFEAGFKSLANVLDSNSLCASVSGKNQSIKYETPKFLVVVRSDVDCNYSAANTSKYGSKGIHQSLFLGIKNGTTYLVSVVASQADWAKNSTFYQDKIFGSVQPK
jgi:hypothetical protein